MRVKAFLKTGAPMLALLAAAAVPASAAPGSRGDWPQFRGAHQDGRATDKGVLLRE